MIERLWPGETFVCIGNGPSLTRDDVDFVKGKARVIAINVAVKLAPWADVLYAADARVWRLLNGAPEFAGLKVSIEPTTGNADRANPRYGVTVLQNTGDTGLELAPTGLRTGLNGGYQAINLAVHLGATRILLLGYDMTYGETRAITHWEGAYQRMQPVTPYGAFRRAFQTMVKPLRHLGVEVINCSRHTALTCFPQMPIEAALTTAVAA